MLLKGPRTSAGASGLGSHMSRWLGPPESQKSRTDFLFLKEIFGEASAMLAKGRAAKGRAAKGSAAKGSAAKEE